MYEHHTEPLLPSRQFVARFLRHGQIAALILVFSLAVGTMGFHWLALEDWIDAFLNTSMLLGGMGPVGEIRTFGGKVFASLFALYAGIVFIATAGLVVVPIVHRIQHKIRQAERGK